MPFFALFRNLVGRGKRDRDLDAEVRAHLDLLTEEKLREGLTAAEARRAARIELGGLEQVKEEVRSVRSGLWLEQLWQDVRYGVRALRKDWGFTLLVVLILTLAIGVNSAVFSLVDAILVQPLPYPDSSQLYALLARDAESRTVVSQLSYPDFADLRSASRSFADSAILLNDSWTLTGSADPVRIDGLQVSPGLLSVLGVRPALGRSFLPEDIEPGRNPVVLLSDRLWRDRFGSDPGILQKTIELDSRSYSVIGVLPRGFHFEFPVTPTYRIKDCDAWIPLSPLHPFASYRGITTFEVLTRLHPDTSSRAAQTELDLLGRRLEAAHPDTNKGRGFLLVPLQEHIAGDVRSPLMLLFGASGFVLLIACANAASLAIGRALAREQQTAVRSALGASPARLIRLALSEHIILAAVGGICGSLLAAPMAKLLLGLPGGRFPVPGISESHTRVVLFASLVCLLAGILFGAAPAALAARAAARGKLLGALRTRFGDHSKSIRSALVAAEISLVFMLLVSVALLAGSLAAVLKVPAGFQPDGLFTFEVSPPPARYPQKTDVVTYYDRLRAALEQLPGIAAVGASGGIPLGGSDVGSALWIEDRPLPPGQPPPAVGWQMITPGYFRAMGTTILRGRDFSARDLASENHVTLINEALARQFFPGQNPVGKRISFGVPDPRKPDWHQVIGVVADVREIALDSPAAPHAYDLFGQHWDRELFLVVRVRGIPRGLAASLTGVVRSIDPVTPVFSLRSMNQVESESVAPRGFLLILVACFAALAVLLAAAGIYGVMSYAVARRTPEIGVRMALGASPSGVLWMVLASSAKIAAVGIAVGVAGALALAGVLSRFLYGVAPTDLRAFAAAATFLLCVALAACFLPARRAARVDPIIALRYE